jgi:hypothetical protein
MPAAPQQTGMTAGRLAAGICAFFGVIIVDTLSEKTKGAVPGAASGGLLVAGLEHCSVGISFA